MHSDEELMQQFAGGDLNALGLLYSRYRPRVYTLCRHLTGDAVAADDLVQESFLRVLRYGTRFNSRSLFTTWLFRVVRNVCHDYQAKQNKETNRLNRYSRDVPVDPPCSADPDARLELVRKALIQLPPAQREVLVLSRFENLRYAEIAALLDTTVDAVKTRAHRAMRGLRQNYSELEQGK